MQQSSSTHLRSWLVCIAWLAFACSGELAPAPPSGDAGVDASKVAPATPCVPDESAPVPSDRCSADGSDHALPPCKSWIKVEPPGAECSNGSQYKFFVSYSNTSNNLVVMFEPGGACWDYASCSGALRGAANPDGIEDDHMATYQFLNLVRRSDENPVHDWNMVFVSYCTGDLHAGDKVATYEDPEGGPALTYRHVGHKNTLSVVDWLKTKFTTVPKLLVTGCSAGGIAALQNYFYLRDGVAGTQCGYLLDDSGPAFHSDGPSKQLHTLIRSAWNLDPQLEAFRGKLPVDVEKLKTDFGLINIAMADRFPHDRLSLAAYRMDFNYSLCSYARSYPDADEAQIHRLWGQDLDALEKTFDTRPNLAYYVPFFRRDNCSHCVSIPPIDHDTSVVLGEPWLGSEIEQYQINLRDFTDRLLDDSSPLQSYREDVRPEAQFGAEQVNLCLNAK